MNDDLFQSVPQAIADELRRRCQLYEAQRGDSQSHVTPFEAEQRVAELFAKENGLWIPMDQVFNLGTPGPSGNENDTYVSNDVIFKVNNLLNSGSILRLFDKVRMHNEIISCWSISVMTMLTVPSVRILRTAGEAFSPIRNEIHRFVSMMTLTCLSGIVEFLPYKFALTVNFLLRNLVGVEH